MLYRIENLTITRKKKEKASERSGPGDKAPEKSGKEDKNYRLEIRHLFIEEGARLAITGKSGCGKSTTLDILGLALKPDSAECFRFSPDNAGTGIEVMPLWNNRQLDDMAAHRLQHIGYVLQTGGLLPYLNVEENMTLTALMAGKAEKDAGEAAGYFAEKLGIADKLKKMPATLSVGERQRVAIARALLPEPKLILADEPTSALDPDNAENVMQLFLRELKPDSALVMVTHHADMACARGLIERPFRRETGENDTAVYFLDDRMPDGAFSKENDAGQDESTGRRDEDAPLSPPAVETRETRP